MTAEADMQAARKEQTVSRLARLGEPCAVALLAALPAAVPTALRARGASLLDGLVAATAVLLCLVLPLALLKQRAARGLRGLLGRPPPRSLAAGVALWIGLSVTLLALLATLLKATTHHRGLGGATFGVFGLALVVAAAVLARRLVAWGRRLPGWAAGSLVAALALGPLIVVALPAAASLPPPQGAMKAAVLDTLLLLVLSALLLSRELPKAVRRASRLVAAPLALGILVVGLVRIETAAATGPALRAGGGLPAALLGALEAWTDRDRDGSGAHFGGWDCDEGDPRRHPGAVDRPGDGIDSDCDGVDPPAVTKVAEAAAAEPSAAASGGAPPAKVASVRPEPTASAAAATASASASATAAEPPSDKPDIILVTLDTVRADHTSAYGYRKKTTPQLSRLAERGVLFEHAFAIGTTTQEALIPLVSGKRLSETPNTGIEWPAIREEVNTVAERLSSAGYVTAVVSSFTWLRRDRGFEQGFKHFDETPFRDNHPERKSTGAAAAKAAIELHRKLAQGPAPIFLWLHLFDPHSRYLRHEGIDFGHSKKGRYDGEIAFADRQLGKLVDAVAASARAERTLWIVHGSHGEAFGEHQAIGHGATVYNEELAVPLVIAGAQVEAGRYGKAAVSTLDLAPTVLEVAGASPKGVSGQSLRPIIEGDRDRSRDPIFAYTRDRTAIIDWPLKLIVFHRSQRPDRLLLFDIASDFGERKDLSGERGEDLKRLNSLRDAHDDSSGEVARHSR